jgi:hypothetical protein
MKKNLNQKDIEISKMWQKYNSTVEASDKKDAEISHMDELVEILDERVFEISQLKQQLHIQKNAHENMLQRKDEDIRRLKRQLPW